MRSSRVTRPANSDRLAGGGTLPAAGSMTDIFVTGGTGFLGRHLLERAHAAGHRVTALCRGAVPSEWASLGIRPAEGRLDDAESLCRAMPDGVDTVFHLAADTSSWRGDRARQERTNVGGTEAAIEATRRVGARRLVHVSSISVWGHPGGVIDETTPQRGRDSRVGYARTKAIAEDRVRAAVAEGLDAVIVNPTHILGRHDRANWARLFLLMDRGKLPGVPPGGGCFANAGDVAAGILAAAEVGRRGENYILGGPWARFLEVTRIIAGLLGKPAPRRATPAALLYLAGAIGDLKGMLTGRAPDITLDAAWFVCHEERSDCSRARAELGYRTTPLESSLAECHAWLAAEGLIGRG